MRNIISHDFQFCVTGCGGLETTHHLFLSSLVFTRLWGMVRSWIGVSSADSNLVHDQFVQFIHSFGELRSHCSFLQLIWLCFICVMWNEWNNKVFKAKENTTHQMLDEVELLSFWWLKAYSVNLGLNSHMWWSSSFVCIGIV